MSGASRVSQHTAVCFFFFFALSSYHFIGGVLHVVHVVLEELTSGRKVGAHCLPKEENKGEEHFVQGDETKFFFFLRRDHNSIRTLETKRSALLTCLRWLWGNQSCPPSVLCQAAVSSWLFSRLPQMPRLHLSPPIRLLPISSVHSSLSPLPPWRISSRGLLPPGQLPRPWS